MSFKKKDFILFLMASACVGVSQSIDSAVFNNFLNDTFHLTISQRTLLEIPREFPGLIVVFVSGFLLFLGDVRLAALANLLAAVGMFSIGFLSSGFSTMLVWLLTYSMGQHLFMPISNSIGMNLAEEGNLGKRLGQINAVNTAAFLVASFFTALIFKFGRVNYKIAFFIGAIFFLFSFIFIMFMTPAKKNKGSKKFILKKEYKLFYILSILFGARKQIFITFGPWVLIKIFNQGVSTFAILTFLVAAIGIFFKPFLGHLIDTVGERIVLISEAVCLVVVCIGYAFSKAVFGKLGISDITVYVICGCFIVDQLLAAVGMARATYLKKTALKPEDVSPTLSMGISMDHLVSMFVPFIGGFIWNKFGYEYVFVAGACIAVINMFVASKIQMKTEILN